MPANIRISKRLVGINIASTVLTRILSIGVLLWTQYYLLRRISPEEFSIYPLVGILLFLLPLISSIFSNSSVRYVTAAYAKRDSEKITEIISTLTPIVVGSSIILLIIGLTASYYVNHIFVISPDFLTDARLMMGLLVISGACTMILDPFTTSFYTLQRFVLSNVIILSGELFKLAILCVLLIGVSPRIIWVVVAHTATTIIVSVVRATLSYKMMSELTFSSKAIRWNMAKELIEFGLASLIIQISKFMRGSAAIWILNRFASPVDVVSFHLGNVAYRQTWNAWMPVRSSIEPPLIAMHATNQQERLQHAYYRGGRLSLWLIMFICTPLMVFREEVIHLYAGQIYLLSAGVMLLLLLRMPLEFINSMLPQIARAKGKIKPLAIVLFGSECVSIVAMLLVIWNLGQGAIGAAAISLAITLFTELFAVWPLGLKMINGTRVDSLRKTVVPGLIPAIVAGAVWYGSLKMMKPDTWGDLFIAALPGIAVYIVIGYLCLLPEDRKDLRKVMKQIKSRLRY